ncbi:cell wall-active antibiotics response protein LiaF [Salsuginibacillus kocurii]|uniref:cell wall-active antibiotics response protein LiaF n=1 Tax=Salsuginibacillus kocurii TaxID=427078 RepID=UPI0003A15343|nr:cell wall-active antibiotics response protein LiaF [Salsuginibacillus kocurii]
MVRVPMTVWAGLALLVCGIFYSVTAVYSFQATVFVFLPLVLSVWAAHLMPTGLKVRLGFLFFGILFLASLIIAPLYLYSVLISVLLVGQSLYRIKLHDTAIDIDRDLADPAKIQGALNFSEPPPLITETLSQGYHGNNRAIHVPVKNTIWLGSLRMGDQPFVLQDFRVKHGIGEVHLDISRAVSAQKRAHISIRSGIGETVLYIPYGVPCQIHVHSLLGKQIIFGQQEKGILPRTFVATGSKRRREKEELVITASVLVGKIRVEQV